MCAYNFKDYVVIQKTYEVKNVICNMLYHEEL